MGRGWTNALRSTEREEKRYMTYIFRHEQKDSTGLYDWPIAKNVNPVSNYAMEIEDCELIRNQPIKTKLMH